MHADKLGYGAKNSFQGMTAYDSPPLYSQTDGCNIVRAKTLLGLGPFRSRSTSKVNVRQSALGINTAYISSDALRR